MRSQVVPASQNETERAPSSEQPKPRSPEEDRTRAMPIRICEPLRVPIGRPARKIRCVALRPTGVSENDVHFEIARALPRSSGVRHSAYLSNVRPRTQPNLPMLSSRYHWRAASPPPVPLRFHSERSRPAPRVDRVRVACPSDAPGSRGRSSASTWRPAESPRLAGRETPRARRCPRTIWAWPCRKPCQGRRPLDLPVSFSSVQYFC